MLEVKKELLLNGEIKVNETIIISLTATIRNGKQDTYISQTIHNHDVYEKNLKSVREQIRAFQDLVWEEEDKLMKQNQKKTV